MVRRWFFILSIAVVVFIAALAQLDPTAWALLVLAGPLIMLGTYNALQSKHTLLRNFPLIGYGRYLLEAVRPELQQYFIESNTEGKPVEREMRSIVYQRSKGELETIAFGTQRDVYRTGYEWAAQSLSPVGPLEEEPRITIGQHSCKQPYSASLFNISALSYGSLSNNAISALSRGARRAGCAHNTGEGGISPYHREGGADLVWQIGTGYFGCRTSEGRFDPQRFRDQAAHEHVKMIELKLSQGAKPGHGGILPAMKVTREIAGIRGVSQGETVFSPPGHSAFSTPRELVMFIARLRELAGGKPVGFKLCVGRRTDVLAICKAMLETDVTPDFITVDGGEGGTGAAPLEFANSIGMPGRDALIFVHSSLQGVGLRDRVKVISSGKVFTGFHMARALALGADLCASARGMMLALGCIQALRCNHNTCPTGVATQNPALVRGLHVGDKAERVYRYHQGTLRGFLELLGSMGLCHPDELRPHHIYRRVDDLRVRHFGELYDFLDDRALLEGRELPEGLAQDWERADPDRWTVAPEAGPYGGTTRRTSMPSEA